MCVCVAGCLTLLSLGQVIAPIDGALVGTAAAQVTPGCTVGGQPGPGPYPVPPPGGSQPTTTFTCSWSTSTSAAATTVEVEDHRTRVTAVRGETVVFDQSVDAPSDSPEVLSLEAQAAAALAAPGCTSVAVLDATRYQTGSSTADTVEVVAGDPSVEHAVAPSTVQIGDRDSGGTPYSVVLGENFNFQTNFDFVTLTTTTNTFLNEQHRRVSGTCAARAVVAEPRAVG